MDLGWGESVGDQGFRFVGPFDDIDFFTAQFTDDSRNAGTFLANTGTDWVDTGIIGKNGNLGAGTSFASDSFDFYRATGDFWRFETE